MKFGFSGLWSHVGSTLLAAALPVADALVSYFGKIELPTWAHAIVGIVAAILAFYKGKVQQPAPSA